MNYAIEVKNLTKSYKNINVVNHLNLHVPEGKIYGFLGRNGAGKTTTIRMITGLIKPDDGEIAVFGRDIRKDRKWAARNIGSIVESPGFYENLTAVENLGITAEMHGSSRGRIDEVLNIVQLAFTGRKKVKYFSQGMKQRLGIANALLHSPKILILDEPTNGLDPSGIKDMRDFLRKLSAEQGITVMVSSHLLGEIQQVADCVGIIDSGRLVEETDIDVINSEDQNYLQIEADHMEKTVAVINNMRLGYSVEQGIVKVFCSREMNSRINKNLVMQGVNVFSLSSVSKNLEDRFLSITQGNTNLA